MVTGGAGYLGSVLCPMLLERGDRVRCLDRLYFGSEPIEPLLAMPSFELVRGNLADLVEAHEKLAVDRQHGAVQGSSRSQLDELLSDVDAIVHLSGLANDPTCELDPELTRRSNVLATLGLAAAARDAGIERFVFASSCSVYGAAADDVVDEESPCRPVSLYAEGKIQCETSLNELARPATDAAAGFTPVHLRQATLFGWSPRMRFDLAVNLMTLHAVTKRKIIVLGGGRQWRPFVHVADSARAFLAALDAPADRVRALPLNVGSVDSNYRIADLARTVAERLGGIELEVVPEDEDKRSYHVAFDRIPAALGWKAEKTVAEGADEIAKAIRDGKVGDAEKINKYWNIRTLKEALAIPAVKGGEPVRSSVLPFALPQIGVEEEQEVLATLRSGWITTGPRTARLEQMIAEYVGAKHAICVNSCTAALHLSLVAAGVGPGDEVVTSPITWPSTANVVVHQGAVPVFVDVEPDTFNMDPDQLEAAITERTKAIVPVHMAGQPADLERIRAIARARNIPVIEDAAHAIGARFRDRPVGSISEATCFSFYPIKNMTTGEGGCVTTDDDGWAETIRIWSLHGISRDAWKRYSSDASPSSLHWECVAPGFKYNMPDLAAALGIHQLRRLEGFIEQRRKIARRYDRAFADLPELVVPKVSDGIRHAWHLYIVMIRPELLRITRDEFILALRAEGIATGIHFRSVHLQPWYRQRFGFQPDSFPIAAKISDRIISLPLYPKMESRDTESVIRAVRKLVEHYR